MQTIKQTLTIVTLLLTFQYYIGFSQNTIGNEWIKYDQTYVKIVVDSSAIYRITRSELEALSFPAAKLNDFNKIQLFYRGTEIAITVNTGGDLTFDGADYIEFYGKRNDGELDKEIYRPKTAKPHPYFSVFNNNTYYFLTVGNTDGKRIPSSPAANTDLIPENYYKGRIIKAFKNEYNIDINAGLYPSLQTSYYQNNEGYCSRRIRFDPASPLTFLDLEFNETINLTNLDPTFATKGGIRVETMVNSRQETPKEITINANNVLAVAELKPTTIQDFDGNPITYTGFDFKKTNLIVNELPSNLLPLRIYQTKSNLSTIPVTDFFSVSYYKIDFPKLPIFENKKEYEIKSNLGVTRLQLSATPANIFALDVTDFANVKSVLITDANVANSKDIYINSNNTERTIWISNETKKPLSMILKNFGINNMPVDASLYNYLIVTDPALRGDAGSGGANDFAAYRASSEGGSHKPIILETKNLYDEFFYGERSPIALRRMAMYFEKTGNPKFLLLIGNGYTQPRDIIAKEPVDLVPSIGYPACDICLTSDMNGFGVAVPSIPTGRLPVKTIAEIKNYLDKVKKHEGSRTTGDWQKNVIHMSGPLSSSENSLTTSLEELRTIAKGLPFGANADNYPVLQKPAGVYVDVDINANPTNDFYTKVNAGAGIITYFGHGSQNNVSQNFGNVSDPARGYTDNQKYSVLIANGCGISNTFTASQTSYTSNWITTANRGAILTLGQSFLSFEFTDYSYMKLLYKNWLNTPSLPMLNKPMGEIIQKTHQDFSSTQDLNNNYNLSNLQILILFGDPAVAPLSRVVPLAINSPTLKVSKSNDGNKIDLSWTTDEPARVKRFVVERSVDLKEFAKIADINSDGKNIERYAYTDLNPNIGLNYYRVKVVAGNEDINYSNVVVENIVDLESGLKILTNPIANNVVNIELKNADTKSAFLTNTAGKRINLEQVQSGKLSFKIVEKLPNGLYIFQISNTNKQLYQAKILISN